MALSVVQSTNYNSGGSISTSGTIVYTTTPTQNNLLVVGLSYAGPKHPSAAPAGWTQIDDLENGTSAWLTTYYHKVGASETNSYTFTTTGGDFFSIVAYEITGQDGTSPINQHSIATGSSAGQVTPSVTPSVIGTLPLAFIGYNDGTDIGGSVTVSTGWTLDQNPQPLYHSSASASKNSLTSDTSTAISTTFTWSGDTNISSTVLIAPSTPTTLSISVSDAESEAELVTIRFTRSINVHDAETQAESVTIRLTRQIKVVETETEVESITIAIISTLSLNVSDAESEGESVTISIISAGISISVSDAEAESEAGFPNNALQFNGVSQYVEIPSESAFSVPTTGALTISFWMRPDDINFSTAEVDPTNGNYVNFLGREIYGSPNQVEWLFRMYNNIGSSRPNRISFYVFNSTGGIGDGSYFQDAITIGQWINVVGVINSSGTTITIYKNGVNRASNSYAGITPAVTSAPLRFATTNEEGFFYGALNDVIIWNRALSDAEVAQVYVGNPPSSGIVGNWSFSDGSGSTLTDSSGNGYDGTLQNSPLWTPRFINEVNQARPFINVSDFEASGASTTFGYTSIGGSSANTPNAIGSKFTLTQPANISSISVYAAAASGTTNIEAAIYSDNAGAPQSLLASSPGSSSVGTTPAWVTIPISVILPAGTYWLWSNPNTSRTIYWTTGSTNQYNVQGIPYNSWPDPITPGSYFARQISIYATYLPGINDTATLQSLQTFNVSDTESENELVTITIPNLGTVSVADAETESELVTIKISILGVLSVSDVETENELVTILISSLGGISVSDADADTDNYTRTNYQLDPSFATSSGPWVFGTAQGSGGTGTCPDSDMALFGTTSAKLVNTAGPNTSFANAIFTGLTPGTTYTFSGYFYISSYTSGSILLDAKSQDFSQTYGISVASVVQNTWTRLSVTFTLPAGQTTLRTIFDAGGFVGTVYFDGALLEIASTALPYFDGTFTGASWTGAANDSTSTISWWAGNIQIVDILSVSDIETEVDTITNIEIIDEGIFITDSETEGESVTIELFSFINVNDSETETELITIGIPISGSISVIDVESESDVISNIETFSFISITDSEVENELVTIIIPTLGAISVNDSESESEFVTITVPLLGAISINDIEAEGELVTIRIPTLGKISVVDTESESDVVSDIEIINFINVSDAETEGELVTITLINSNISISVSDTEIENELVTVLIPLLGPISVSDIETELDVINNIELVNFINVASAETESDVIVDIEVIDEGIFVIDSETENELVVITIPLLGQINVSDVEIEVESVTIRVPEEGTIFVQDTETENELVTIDIPLLGRIDISDAETEGESVNIEIPTLGTISVSDIETESDVVIGIELANSISVYDTETEGESVTIVLVIAGINIFDIVTESELVTIGITNTRNIGPYIVMVVYDSDGYLAWLGNKTITVSL